jgi:hypothetical protein
MNLSILAMSVSSLVACALVGPSNAQCVTSTEGLIAWWTGEGNARDTVGVADGVLVNGVTLVPNGLVSQAFAFDGVTGCTTIAHNSALQPTNITVEAWIKTPGSTDMQLVVDKSHGPTNDGWALHVMPDGRIVWGYGYGSGFPACFSTGTVDDDAWHHVAATLDGSMLRVFIDGAPDGTLAYPGSPVGNTRPVHIGAWYTGDLSYSSASFTRHFNGLIDEVSLYSRALTAAEVQAIHAAGSAGKCSDSIYTFHGNVLDLGQWRVSSPLGNATVTQDDAIDISNNGGSGTYCFTPGNFGPGAGIALRRKIAGDFDIQVAFRDFAGPYADHVQAFLQVYQDPGNQVHIKRIRGGSVDGIQSVASVGGVFPLQTGVGSHPSTRGVFRIVRSGSHITTFIDDLPHFALTAFSGPVIVSMSLASPPFTTTSLPTSVEYDGFFIRRGTLIEPPVGCPGPPVADAGLDALSDEGELVQLDGTGSSDPDDDFLTYVWEQVAGPLVLLSDMFSATPTFTAPLVPLGGATLTFQLVVDDGQVMSAPDTVDVTITNVNNPPIALAGHDQLVVELGSVELDGSNSYDPDSEDLSYSWMQTAGAPVTLFATDPAKPTFTAPLVGQLGETLTFELTVSDGLDSDLDSIDVLIVNHNNPPTADAGLDQTRTEGQLVLLDASSSDDPDGDMPLTYAWMQQSGPLVLLSNASSPTPIFAAPPVGPSGATLVFVVTVGDGYGGSDGDEVTITVQDGNAAPACELARASKTELWPPNHKLVPISILGVTDPENGATQITILGVTQDEPLNGLGDGDTTPDAVIQGSTVLIRAERSGTGNGRVYCITFRAEDGAGGTCTGSVHVCVPHSRGNHAQPCVDDGQSVDSLGS